MAQVRRRGPSIYTISIYVGRNKQGKREYYNETYYGGRTQAKHRAAELEVELKRYVGPKYSSMKLGEYLDKWLYRVKDSVADRTYETYSWHVSHLIRCVGDLQLYTLKALDLQERLDELKYLSSKSVRGICSTLRTALRQAVAWDLISKDPTAGIKTPKVQVQKRKILTKEEHYRLLEATRHYKLGLIIYIIAETGMRLGEALGLLWSDINFDNKSITISRSANVRSRELNYTTKTNNSKRTIRMTGEMVSLLKDHYKIQNESKIKPIKGSSELVFSSEDGRVVHEMMVRRALKRVLKKAGINEDMRIHDLRHSAGSLMLDNGYSLSAVAEMLGQNPQTTASIYTHAIRKAGVVSNTFKSNADIYADKNS